MQQNTGPRSPARGGGTGRGRHIQPSQGGSLPRSLIPARPRSVMPARDNSDEQTVTRTQASMLQSARQVGIRGGNFNTVGTNQLNFTFNLAEEREAHNLAQPENRSDINEGHESTPGGRLEEDVPLNPSSSHSNAAPRRGCDIYYHHIGAKGRGSALWIPEPSKSLHIDYRRKGISIGDVGIITEFGAFDFLFNICLSPENPINPPELPENFATLSVPQIDIHQYSEFTDESYLSSASITQSRHEGEPSGLIFESSASEGAILTMPVGSNSEDLRDTRRFRNYVAVRAQSWYEYAYNIRGREVKNGEICLVIGFDKATAWGMATFSNSAAQNTFFRLKFRPTELGDLPRQYRWECAGSAEVRTGPDARQIAALRGNDPSQAGVEYENQTLFIRTMNVTLQKDIWTKLALDLGEINVDNEPTASPGPRDPPGPGSGRSYLHPPQSSFQSGSHAGNIGTAATTVVNSVHFNPLPASLSGHPSKGINEMLLNLKPSAKMAITEDDVWISVLTENDCALPPAEDLNRRIMESFVLREEEDIIFLEKRQPALSTPLSLDRGDVLGDLSNHPYDIATNSTGQYTPKTVSVTYTDGLYTDSLAGPSTTSHNSDHEMDDWPWPDEEAHLTANILHSMSEKSRLAYQWLRRLMDL